MNFLARGKNETGRMPPNGFDRAAAARCAAAALFFAAVWWKLVVAGQLPADGNLLTFFWPDQSLLKRALCAGELPLWNHYKNMGEPFLANPQAMVLYPLSWLSPALSFLGHMRLWVFFHTALAFAFSYLTLNRLLKDRDLAFTGAFLYAFSAFFIAKVTLLNYLASAAWLPVITYFYCAGSLPGLCAAASLQLLSGFPPYALITFLALAAFTVVRQREKLPLLLKAYGLAAGVCAALLLPFLQMLSLSTRELALSPAAAAQFSVGPLYLLKQLLVPLTYFRGYATDGDPALLTFYAGPLLSGLAVFAAVRGGGKDRAAAAFALAFFLLSLGGNLPFYGHLPFMNIFRFPAHWLLPGLVFTVYLAVRGLSLVGNPRLRGLLNILLLADAFSNALYTDLAWVKPGYYEDVPAIAAKMRSEGEGARVLHSARLRTLLLSSKLAQPSDYIFLREILAPSLGAAYGVPEAASYQVLTSKKAAAYLKGVEDSGFNPALLDAAAIKLVLDLEKGGIKSRWNKGARDILYCLPGCKSLKYQKRNSGFSVELDADGPVRLVLAEIFYPGWTAAVDGRPVSIGEFKDAFMSVEAAGKGRRSVSFRYRPLKFYAGLLISLMSLVFLAWLALRRNFKGPAPDVKI